MASGSSSKEVDQLLSMHGTMVETACGSENKRQTVSVASAGLISGGIAIYASNKQIDPVYLCIPFLIISSIWFVTVRFYQKLAVAKWEVVHQIEGKLCYQPFKIEWDIYKENRGIFTFGPSTLEQIIPAIIFILSLSYSIARLVHWAFF